MPSYVIIPELVCAKLLRPKLTQRSRSRDKILVCFIKMDVFVDGLVVGNW
jgi:hypothetical protein